MKILIVNAGSSSLKYELMDMTTETTIAKGQCDRIAIEGSNVTHKVDGKKIIKDIFMNNHVEACNVMLAELTNPEYGSIKDMSEIDAVGHRVLHGGMKFTGSIIINDDVIAAIEENIPLGPLHNPANLQGIRACMAVMPTTPMVAVFDTAFHMTMPPKAYRYGLPEDYYTRLKVRRYGFHGTSHRYVSARAAEFVGKKPEDVRVITVHLGNGSSIAAVDHGKCIDTSMGLTPLEGLIMGTRAGSMDPAVVQYICNSDNITVDEMLEICNKKSGLLGVSCFSSDSRDIEDAAAEGHVKAKLAADMLVYGIVKYVGAYTAAMNGVDIIAFTGGIGENNPLLREEVIELFGFIGASIDKVKNDTKSKEIDISGPDSKVRILITPTNEEIAIARDTMELVNAL